MAANAKGKANTRIGRGEPLPHGRAGGESQFGIAKGSNLFVLAEQVCVTPAPKSCGIARASIRFLSNSKGRSVITDVEHASNLVLQRIVHQPIMQRLYFHAFPVCVGYTQKHRIGNPSALSFLDSERNHPRPRASLVRGLPRCDAVQIFLQRRGDLAPASGTFSPFGNYTGCRTVLDLGNSAMLENGCLPMARGSRGGQSVRIV
jgi:hypothetical protein